MSLCLIHLEPPGDGPSLVNLGSVGVDVELVKAHHGQLVSDSLQHNDDIEIFPVYTLSTFKSVPFPQTLILLPPIPPSPMGKVKFLELCF